jgi:hypothetical protein
VTGVPRTFARDVSVGVRPRLPAAVGLGWGSTRSALLGFLVVAALAVSDGGYWPTAWGWSALALIWAAVLALLLRPDPRVGTVELAFLGALIALLGWIALSTAWTRSLTQTVLETQRTLVYVAGVGAALLLVLSGSYRALLGGVWAAISLVCLYALLTRLFSERLGAVDVIAGNRLSEPIGYWNALGVFAAAGALLALGMAARARRPVLRALAGASLVVLVPTLYFTFSRGAWIALGAGVLAAVALDPRRLQLVTAILLVGSWAALGVWVGSRSAALTRIDSSPAEAAEDGRRLAIVLALLAAAGAVAALALVAAERRLRIARSVRLAYAGILVALLLAGLVALFVRFGSPPAVARDAYDAFRGPPPRLDSDLNRRLFNLSGGARRTQWRVAWNDYEADPWLGSGAGSYEGYWLQHRQVAAKVKDAHSLYLETLAELGPVGLGLLVTALGIPFLAAVRARDRGLVPAALGAYSAYVVHAGVDWDWEMPAVTLAALFCGAAVLAASRGRVKTYVLSARFRIAGIVAAGVLGAWAFTGLIGNVALAASEDAATRVDRHTQEADARKASRWAPWSSAPWRLLGEAQLARGDLAAARENLRRAIDKDPRDWRLWYDLALASAGTAQRRALARALHLNPLEPELVQLRSELGGGAG